MTSQSEPSSASNETSESLIESRLYQRKVRVTVTRAEAHLLRAVMMRVAADESLAALFGMYGSPRAVQRRAKNIWNKVDRQIERRDTAMRQKVHRASASLDSIDLVDPVVDLGDRPLLDLDPNRAPEENY